MGGGAAKLTTDESENTVTPMKTETPKRIRPLLIRAVLGLIVSAGPPSVKAQTVDGAPQLAIVPSQPTTNGDFERVVTSYDGVVVAMVVVGISLPGLPPLPPSPPQVVIFDRATGEFELASRTPNGGFQNANPSSSTTRWLSISSDGRYVAFSSRASNLDPAVTPGREYTYVYDRVSRRVRAMNADLQGDARGTLAGDGRLVGMICTGAATGLPSPQTGICLRRVDDLSLQLVVTLPTTAGLINAPVVTSADGNHLLFAYNGPGVGPGDLSQGCCIYVVDVRTGLVDRVATAVDGATPDGGSGPPFAISADGDFVAFVTAASNLIPGVPTFNSIVVKQRSSGIIRRVSSTGSWGVDSPVLSADGRRVMYMDYGFYIPGQLGRVYDWETQRSRFVASSSAAAVGSFVCASNPIFGIQPRMLEQRAAMSGDGRTIHYPLVEDRDVNGRCDLYTRQLGPVPAPATSVSLGGSSMLLLLALALTIAAIRSPSRHQ
jgi:hypothetical protein